MNPRTNGTVLVIMIVLVLNFVPVAHGVSGQIPSSSRSYIPHATIFIESDSEFTAPNGIVAGDGSENDPYIIENWTIDATDIIGIQIQNTTAHFIIRMCEVHGGAPNHEEGIILRNVTNGTIRDNLIRDNYDGILLSNSMGNTISNNTIHGNPRDGLNLQGSVNNSISLNTVNGSYYGIAVGSDSDRNTVFDNIIHNNSCSGIIVDGSSHNDIFGNEVRDNEENGVEIAGSHNVFRNNTVSGNHDHGVFVDDDCNVVTGNDIYHNWNRGLLVSGGFPSQSCQAIVTNKIHHNRDGVIALYSGYYDFIGNHIYSNNETGVLIQNGAYNLIERNVIETNGGRGLVLDRSGQLTVNDNEIRGNQLGMSVFDVGSSEFDNNVMADNSYNIGMYTDNHFKSIGMSTTNTVDGKPIYYWIEREKEEVPSDAGYIVLVDCQNITVVNATLTHNLDGVILVSSSGTIIKKNDIENHQIGIKLIDSIFSHIHDNDIGNNQDGIRIESSRGDSYNNEIDHNIIFNNSVGINQQDVSGQWVHNNTFANNEKGMDFFYSSNHLIMDNEFRNNTDGMFLYESSKNEIVNNTFHYNGDGVHLRLSNSNSVRGNLILDNSMYGIVVNDSYNNLVFNNIFSNENDYLTTHFSTVSWNIAKTQGPNVVNGPFLGGNYWPNYTGEDIDGDFLGDTEIPYGPGDNHPLLMGPPSLTDLTEGSPETGSTFIFNSWAAFRFGVSGVHVEYWFDNGSHTNLTMNLTAGDDISGKYSAEIYIPWNATVLNYFMSANNTYDIWNVTPIAHLNITDIYPPSIEDESGIPTTGDDFTLAFNITDVFGISRIEIGHRFDEGPWNVTITENATMPLIIPPDAYVLEYFVNVSDMANNSAFLSNKKDVLDNDIPNITDLSGIPETGNSYIIECAVDENRAIDNVSIMISLGGDVIRDIMDLDPEREEHYFIIDIPENITEISYVIDARDTAGNFRTANATKAVKDIIKPILVDLSWTPTTGDPFVISVRVEDNIAIKQTTLDYWFDDSPHFETTFQGDFTLNVPASARMLGYEIRSIDTSNNVGNLTRNVIVEDNDPPFIEDMFKPKVRAGTDYLLVVSVYENIEIETVWIEYWLDGIIDNVTLTPENIGNGSINGGKYTYVIGIPKTAKSFQYVVYAIDKAGNLANSTKRTVEVAPDEHQVTDEIADLLWCAIVLLVVILIVVIIVIRSWVGRTGTRKQGRLSSIDDREDIGAVGEEEE